LTAAQSSLVDRTGSLGVVAVVDDPCILPGRGLQSMLERTGLFRAVVASGPSAPATDYLATIQGRCTFGRGAWIPVLPLFTLGVVPEFHRMEMGYAFTLRHLSTGQETVIPCEIRATVGIGWIPLLMNVLPGWSTEDPEKTRTFGRRLAYGIVSRTTPQ
jgi:hypothetical protein